MSEKTTVEAPAGDNPDEWHLFLCRFLDNRAQRPNGLTLVAAEISRKIRIAYAEGKIAGFQDGEYAGRKL